MALIWSGEVQKLLSLSLFQQRTPDRRGRIFFRVALSLSSRLLEHRHNSLTTQYYPPCHTSRRSYFIYELTVGCWLLVIGAKIYILSPSVCGYPGTERVKTVKTVTRFSVVGCRG